MAAKLCKRVGYSDGGGLSLPEDIILEVLLRLPAKALCRFQSVSRSWRALISDPAFVAALRSRATGPLIVAGFGYELRLLDKGGNALMEFYIWSRRPLLVPTHLDRIFVDRGHLGAIIIDPASGYYVTNVGTKNLNLPPPSSAWSFVWSDYSFGRATASGDYKVLRLATSSNCILREEWCHVATIMDGVAEPTWRERPSWGTFYDFRTCEDHKAIIKGVVYFYLYRSEFVSRHRIAAFDLENEEWKAKNIRGPELKHENKGDKWHITLTELKGTLCIVHNVQYLADLSGHYADIWLLKDPNNSFVWVKEYKIEMPSERLLLCTKPLDVFTDGKLLLLNEFKKEGRNTKNGHRYILQLYNSTTKAFTDFMEMAPGFNGRIAFYTGNIQA